MSQNSGGSTIGERAKLKMSSICNVARGQCSQRTAYVLCFPMTTISIPSHAYPSHAARLSAIHVTDRQAHAQPRSLS